MLDNLIFSLNTAMPLFLVMLIGWFLRQKNILQDSFMKNANTLVFYVALPVKLFYDTSRTAFDQAFDTGLVLFLSALIMGSVLAAWVLGRYLIREPEKLGAFVHGCFRGNFLYIGFSLMENITGGISPKTPIAAAFVVPLYNILAVMILAQAGIAVNPEGRIRNTLLGILRNPLIIAIALGTMVSLLSWEMPLSLTRTMEYFSGLTTPLALIAIGASFTLKESLRTIKPALIASSYKLIILPLAAVVLALMAGYTGADVILVYIIFGVPTSTTSYIMTVAMQGDRELASNIIMLSTALSVFSMTAFVFAFRTLGII